MDFDGLGICGRAAADGGNRAAYNARMYTPQAGIFALGTSSHAYLELDTLDAGKEKEFAATIAAIREPRTTTGGVNFVIGFRPELWRKLAPADMPAEVEGFNEPVRGVEGFTLPATQHDALVWLSGSAYDVLFDMARSVVRDLDGLAKLAEETSSWPYRHDRDLTGRRIRPCSTRPGTRCCRRECRGLRGRCCCCRSGGTR